MQTSCNIVNAVLKRAKNKVMGEFPSGQRGQTVNLLSVTSVVQIHLLPPEHIPQKNTMYLSAVLFYPLTSVCKLSYNPFILCVAKVF